MKRKDLNHFLISYFYGAFVSLFSYYMYHIYIGQDLALYSYYYANLTDNFLESFLFYNSTLGSEEPFYFIITFIASGVVSKEILMSISNFFMAYYLSRLILSCNVSILVWALVVTNYYTWVLYLPAERLKFGFLFVLLALYYFKLRYLFYAFSVLSHIQSFICIYIIFAANVKKYLLLLAERPLRSFAGFSIFLIFISTLAFILRYQLTLKFGAYFSKGFDFSGPFKVFILFIFSYISLKNYPNKLFLFFLYIPIAILSFVLGGDRVVMFAVFIFIGLSIYYRKGKELTFFIISFYFLLKTIEFFFNTFTKGYAF